MINIEGKFYIVTGGSRGIGRAVAEQLLRARARVLIVSKSDSPDWILQHKLCEYRSVDFLDKEDVNDFCRSLKDLGAIDGLVNCAGIFYSAPFTEIDEDKYHDVMRVNLDVPFQISREVAKIMISVNSGRIVNVSSIAAFVSRPGSHTYSASKAALVGLTRALALEFAQYNILINTVCPGYTETDMTNNAVTPEQKEELCRRVPLGIIASPDDIASHIVFLVSNMNTYATGQSFIVDGGVTAI